MPDFERLTDQLAVDIAKTPEERAYAISYAEGKSHARVQVAIFFSCFVIGVVLARIFQ